MENIKNKQKNAKQIVINIDGKDYNLEYNRQSIIRMESNGFNIAKIDDSPVTSIDMLLTGAFYKNYSHLSDEAIEKIKDNFYEEYEVKDLVETLLEMFTDAIPQFGNEVSEGKKKFKVVR